MMVGHAVTLNIDRPTPSTLMTLEDQRHPWITTAGVKLRPRVEALPPSRRNSRHCGHRRQRPAGAAARPSRACTRPTAASITATDDEQRGGSVGNDREDRKMGIALAFVPEDRLGMGLVGSMGMTDNMMLRSYRNGHGFLPSASRPGSWPRQSRSWRSSPPAWTRPCAA